MYPLRFSLDQYDGSLNRAKNPYSYPYEELFKGTSPTNDIGAVPPIPPQQELPKPNIADAYSELLNRQSGPAMAEYAKYLKQGYPDEKDPTLKRGKLGKLAAILAGSASGYGGG